VLERKPPVESGKDYERLVVNSSPRNNFLIEFFPQTLVCSSEENSNHVVIEVLKNRFGNGYGGKAWKCLKWENGAKYTLFLSEHPDIKKLFTKDDGTKEEEIVYSYYLEAEAPLKKTTKTASFQDLNLAVFIDSRVEGGRGIVIQDLKHNNIFPLDELIYSDDKKLCGIVSSASRIPSPKEVEIDRPEDINSNTLLLRVAF
jgi:hypothetical protein